MHSPGASQVLSRISLEKINSAAEKGYRLDFKDGFLAFEDFWGHLKVIENDFGVSCFGSYFM